MGTEIERKFLVTDASWQAAVNGSTHYRQGYLSSDPACSVRVRVDASGAKLNIKGATVGVSRPEFEYAIPVADAHAILDQLCIKPFIEKTRYTLEYGGRVWEIDVFEGENAGLVVAEIELDDPDQVFASPPWIGNDVSHDPRYYNQRLVTHPYRTWAGQEGDEGTSD